MIKNILLITFILLLSILEGHPVMSQHLVDNARNSVEAMREKMEPSIKKDKNLRNFYINLGQLLQDFENRDLQAIKTHRHADMIKLRINYRIGDIGLFLNWGRYYKLFEDLKALREDLRALVKAIESEEITETSPEIPPKDTVPPPDTISVPPTSTLPPTSENTETGLPAEEAEDTTLAEEEYNPEHQMASASGNPFDMFHLLLIMSTMTFALLYFFNNYTKYKLFPGRNKPNGPGEGKQVTYYNYYTEQKEKNQEDEYSEDASAEEDSPYEYTSSSYAQAKAFIEEQNTFDYPSPSENEAEPETFTEDTPAQDDYTPSYEPTYEIETKPEPQPELPQEEVDPIEIAEKTPPQQAENDLPYVSYFPPRYFFAELMMTAGPRKKENTYYTGDRDLGEDVLGYMCLRDKVIFWVIDGSSDADILTEDQSPSAREYFSSRFLAQCLGQQIQHIARFEPLFTSYKLLEQAFEQVRQKWEKEIPEEIYKNPLNQEHVMGQLEKKGHLFASTSVLVGILDLEGNLNACKVGNTGLLTQANPRTTPRPSELEQANQAEKDSKIFASISLFDSKIVVDFNPLNRSQVQQYEETNINTVMAMTQGISTKTQVFLQNTLGEVYTKEGGTREILQTLPQNTYDDKSCCVIQIRED